MSMRTRGILRAFIVFFLGGRVSPAGGTRPFLLLADLTDLAD